MGARFSFLMRFLLALLAPLFLEGCATEAPQEPVVAPALAPFHSLDELAEWEMNYYRRPDPARAFDAIRFYCDSGADDEAESRMPFVAFLAEVYRDDSAALRGAFAEAQKSGSECIRLILLNTAWFMRDRTGTELLREAERQWSGETEQDVVDSLLRMDPGDALGSEIGSDTHLQMLWGNFFGSGERAPIDRIIDATLREETPEGEVTHLEMAAMVSLQNVAARDDAVYGFLRDRSLVEQGRRRERLEQVIANVERIRAEDSGPETD